MKTKITSLACWLLCSAGLTFAQPGTLDKTFGTGGKVTTYLSSTFKEGNISAAAIQQDGKILVTGSYFSDPGNAVIIVVRYNSNGTLDNTFGENGQVIIDLGLTDAYADAMAIQPDGKIIVAGSITGVGGSDGLVVRLTTNGTLDGSFNSGGNLSIDFGGWDGINSIALQNDGRIVVAGFSLINNYTTDEIAVARINGSDGHLDGGFGTAGTGKVITIVGSSSSANSVSIQTDGKIVVAGNSYNGNNQNFFIVRYNSNGVLDNTFGNQGKRTIDFGGDDFGMSLAIQTDGKIVVAGYSINSGRTYFAITKLGPLGNPVSNFGVSGKVTTLIGFSAFGYSLAIQTNGKIIVAGAASVPFSKSWDFVLARYNANGSLDNGFGTNGIVTTDFGNEDHGQSVGLQQNGKIVVAGYSLNNNNDIVKIAVARYNGDPVSLLASTENIADASDKKLSASPTIKLFPNPAKDLLNIDGMDASSAKTISIVDMNGRVIQTTTTGNSTHTWNIASLPAGTYYLLIDDKKKKASLKFVKE